MLSQRSGWRSGLSLLGDLQFPGWDLTHGGRGTRGCGQGGAAQGCQTRRGDWRAGRPGGHFPSSVFLADTGGLLASTSSSLRSLGCSPGGSLVAILVQSCLRLSVALPARKLLAFLPRAPRAGGRWLTSRWLPLLAASPVRHVPGAAATNGHKLGG